LDEAEPSPRQDYAALQRQYEAGKKGDNRPLFGPTLLIAGFAGAAYLAVRFARKDKPLSHKLLDARIKSQGVLITVLALGGLYSYFRSPRAENFYAGGTPSVMSRYGSSLSARRAHPWWR